MFEKTTATVISFLFALTLAGCASTSNPPDAAPATPQTADPPVQAAPAPPLQGGNETAPEHHPKGPAARIRPSAPRRYVVKKGDTLWGIAGMFLHEPWYWPELWHANPEIRNPHLIYPGDVLTLYYKGGKPYVQVSGGPRVEGAYHMEKLRPTVRIETLGDTQRVIPIQVIQQLIFQPHVLDRKQIDAAPYILSGEDYRLVYGSGDIVYIRNLDQKSPERLYSVARPGAALRHHGTREVLGYSMDPVGVIELLAGGDPAAGRLLDIKREALTGDRLLHHELEHPNRDFMPHAPKGELDGAVIHLFDAISMIGQLQVAVVDLGTRDGIDRGTVLRTFKTGPTVYDPLTPSGQSPKIKLPNEPAALLMVFSALEKLSYTLVMEAKRPVEIGDTIHSPIHTEPAADGDGPTEVRLGAP